MAGVRVPLKMVSVISSRSMARGDGLAAQSALLAGVVLQVLAQGEGLEDGGGLVDGALAQVGLVDVEGGVRHGVEHVEVAGEQIGVGGVLGGVEDELEAVVLWGTLTLVLVVGDDGGVLVVVPLGQLVRAIGDGVLAVGVHVLVCGLVERVEGGVTQLAREVLLRAVQGDGEGVVVHNLEALELLDALLEALDVGEERGGQLVVGHGVVPRVDEVLGGDRGTVGEGGLLELDGELRVVVVRLDGLSQLVVCLAVAVVVHEAGVEGLDNASAADLVGVGRDERVLRLGAVDDDDPVAGAGCGIRVATTAGRESQRQGCGGQDGERLLDRHVGRGPPWCERCRKPVVSV